MIRYLLGDLPESEGTALAERCFNDNETFDRMWENETRLVDDYICGRLGSHDRVLFEEHYLASPVHRRRVATARNLLADAEVYAGAGSAAEAHPSVLQRLTKWLSLSPAWQFAMTAAILLLIAGAGWLLTEQSRLRVELANMQTENAAQQNRERELARLIEAGRSERNQLAADLDRLRKEQTDPSSRPSLKVFSFALSPIGVRGSTGETLVIPPGADQVQLQLTLPTGDWQKLQAVIETADDKPVWRQLQLKPRGGQVIVTVSAKKLPFDDYILTLSGLTRAGEPEVINRYSFRIIR